MVIDKGVNNRGENQRLIELLRKAVKDAARDESLQDIKNHPRLAPWWRAYADFGTDPNKFYCSMPLATRLRYKHFVGNSGRESGLEKETQDGLICPSCANLVIVSPVFGFILTAKGCCCPGRFLERTIVLPETMCLCKHYPIRPGRKRAICGKSSSRIAQIHRAIR
ncbi:MAG: hypothetical protein WBE46_03465 [Dehalococcoidia bacterium]